MIRPTVSPVADALYDDELGVTQPLDETYGWPFLLLLHGLATALGDLPDIVRDTDDSPGWSAVLDPARCPVWALPWLAQFAGVRLTPGLTEDEWRAEITHPPAFERGTPDAMRRAAQRYLTGAKTVHIIEQWTSAYTLRVTTYASQTPDPAATEALVRSQKPAGLILTYENAPGWDYAEFATGEATYAAAASDFATYDDLRRHL